MLKIHPNNSYALSIFPFNSVRTFFKKKWRTLVLSRDHWFLKFKFLYSLPNYLSSYFVIYSPLILFFFIILFYLLFLLQVYFNHVHCAQKIFENARSKQHFLRIFWRVGVSFPAEVEFEFTTWAWVQGQGRNSDWWWWPLLEWWSAVAATADCHSNGCFFSCHSFAYVSLQLRV